MTLQKYAGKRGTGVFRPMTMEEARALSYGQHIWFLTLQGDAKLAKVNGQPKTWKRTPERLEVSLKYGLYEYGKFDQNDIQSGRLLVELD